MSEETSDAILARTFKAEQFLRWARDGSGAYPFATTFDKWEADGLVCVAEEGYALTTLGRQVAGLPVGNLSPRKD